MVRRSTVILVLSFVCVISGSSGRQPAPEAGPNFNHDVAPIVFEHCVSCHHPGSNAPFSLASFNDVKKRAKLISQVTSKRLMPPWMPEAGHADFVGSRGLKPEQIATLAAWAKNGAPEGNANELNAKPVWNDGWQLGNPNQIVSLPKPFTLPASGPDVYRNFVIPAVIPADAYLRAVEFKPDSSAVHHAFFFFDPAGGARQLDSKQPESGFPGMDPGEGAKPADAMFCTWQPGKGASEAPPGFTTKLSKGTDIVLQMHMRSTGKRESIKPRIALYFSEEPPSRFSFLLSLRSVQIDIPAGQSDYAVDASYRLPVDAEVLSILPHMHYLGKEAHGWAELPDGTLRELILIRRWDFDWQGEYRYASPVPLPKGSTLRMHYVLDNSAANPSNPNHPPQRVTYGIQSSDEMAELWLQLAVRSAAERDTLQREYSRDWSMPDALARAEMMVKLHPHDANERSQLARILIVHQRDEEALREIQRALTDNPALSDAYYLLGTIYSRRNDAPNALAALKRSVELDPLNAQAQNNLGWVLLATGEARAAIRHLEKALELNPNDELARKNLTRARISSTGAPAQ